MRFSKLGTKLVALIAAVLVVLAVTISLTVNLMYKRILDDTMNDEAVTVFNTFKFNYGEITGKIDTAASLLARSTAVSQALSVKDAKTLQAEYEAIKTQDASFADFVDKDGNTVWASSEENIDILHKIYENNNGEQLTTDVYSVDGKLFYINCQSSYIGGGNTLAGFFIVGYDLSDPELVDILYSETGNHVTVFCGNTRMSTTVLNADGDRAIGTTMSPAVEDVVLKQQQVYQGTADVNGINMYVYYEPIIDHNGQALGALFTGKPSTALDQRRSNIILMVTLLAAVVAAISIVLIVVIIRRLIIEPIKKIRAVMLEMSSGNLHCSQLNSTSKDEFGDLCVAINTMLMNQQTYLEDITMKVSAMAQADYTVHTSVNYIGDWEEIDTALKTIRANMGDMFRELNDSAEQVHSGSMQISQGAQMLAEGSATQAGTIEELSASIEEVSSHVNASADAIAQVRTLYDSVDEKIDQQNQNMDEVLRAMRDIEDKSSKIQNIIKAIEDIAFQTNILALNAAVEAARVGAAGKGFAVVADEVRTLAAKSAEAAKETKDLISESIHSVDAGSGIAEHAANSVKEIVALSDQTHTLVEDISEKAAEQAEALRQITAGLDQISMVIQQNSAAAEESSASSVELSTQSFTLKDIINKCKV